MPAMHKNDDADSNPLELSLKSLNGLTILLLILVAGLIRFTNLGADSFWLDEINTLNTSGAGYFASLNVRDHMPLLYMLTTANIQLFGINETALRLTSAVAGTISVGLMALFGMVMDRPKTGMWVALLLAFSPFHLRYSQEARHYALLMCFALTSYLMLYLAMRQLQWRWWFAYAGAIVLALYTHYGGLIVLLTEGIIILVVALSTIKTTGRVILLRAIATGGIIGLAYLPWLPRFMRAMSVNTGSDIGIGVTGQVSLLSWLQNTYLAFGFQNQWLALLALSIFVIGLLLLLRTGAWMPLLFVLFGLSLPFVFIFVFQVARASLPKYVIYLLPLYLFPIGVTLERGTKRWLSAEIGAVIMLVVVLGSTLLKEYWYVERDWRGIVSTISQDVTEHDVFVPVTLDLADGFDQGSIVLPYYLAQHFSQFQIVDGNRLNDSFLSTLENVPDSGRVWVFALNRVVPMDNLPATVTVQQFAGDVFLLTADEGNRFQQLQTLYEALIAHSAQPRPRCQIANASALLHLSVDQFEQASSLVNQAESLCPGDSANDDIRFRIDQGLLDALLEDGRKQEALLVANRLWQSNRNYEVAVSTLTALDFDLQSAVIKLNNAPEAVRSFTVTMPQTGDFGEAILLHPPAEIVFDITLPTDPTRLYTRIAMAPDSWEWGGDGSEFVVEILNDGDSWTPLFQQYVDNEDENRRWQEVSIPLTQYAGQSTRLRLRSTAGPNADSTGDWAVWELPRLFWLSKEE